MAKSAKNICRVCTVKSKGPSTYSRLNLDIHFLEILGARVDPDQTRILGSVELTESGNQTDTALFDLLERIRTAKAEGQLTEATRKRSNAIDHGAVESVFDGLQAEILLVRWLHFGSSKRLDRDQTTTTTTPVRLGGSWSGCGRGGTLDGKITIVRGFVGEHSVLIES